MALDSASLLAQLVGSIGSNPGGGTTPTGQPMSISQSILNNANMSQYVSSPTPPPGSPGPSVVSRIFDLLSRPNYAVASFIKPILDNLGTGNNKQAINNLMPWNAYPHVWHGLEGETKNTFTDMATHDKQAQPILDAVGRWVFGLKTGQSNTARALTGLALDIGTDPTTYIGPGAIKGVLRGAGVLKGAKGLTEASSAASAAADAAADGGMAPADTVDPAGTVLSQTPAPGHKVEPGMTVTFRVSQ